MESSYNEKQWYTIRITHNRTAIVYKAICHLNWSEIELFAPCHNISTFTIEGHDVLFKSNRVNIKKSILPGFLFVKCTQSNFQKLLDYEIPGLTPYYDHFKILEGGNNPYLTIPDHQMENFRKYCDAQDDEHKLTDQKDVPAFLNGKKVRIISGPFMGVEGIVLRWHNMRRVFLAVGDIATFGTGFIRSCDFEVIS